jgi:hypothetical protein
MLTPHLQLIRLVSQVALSTSVHKVVKTVIHNHMPAVTTAAKAQRFIGMNAISGVAIHTVLSHYEPRIEEAVVKIDAAKVEWDNARTQKEQDPA